MNFKLVVNIPFVILRTRGTTKTVMVLWYPITTSRVLQGALVNIVMPQQHHETSASDDIPSDFITTSIDFMSLSWTVTGSGPRSLLREHEFGKPEHCSLRMSWFQSEHGVWVSLRSFAILWLKRDDASHSSIDTNQNQNHSSLKRCQIKYLLPEVCAVESMSKRCRRRVVDYVWKNDLMKRVDHGHFDIDNTHDGHQAKRWLIV